MRESVSEAMSNSLESRLAVEQHIRTGNSMKLTTQKIAISRWPRNISFAGDAGRADILELFHPEFQLISPSLASTCRKLSWIAFGFAGTLKSIGTISAR